MKNNIETINKIIELAKTIDEGLVLDCEECEINNFGKVVSYSLKFKMVKPINSVNNIKN